MTYLKSNTRNIINGSGIAQFLLPNQLSSGGFSGIANNRILFISLANGSNSINIKHTSIHSIIF